MLDFFFLSKEQVFGNDSLSIFKKNPQTRQTLVTDYSILLCEKATQNASFWATRTFDLKEKAVHVVSSDGEKRLCIPESRRMGARPVIKYSQIKSFVYSRNTTSDGILEVEFGEYPQFAVDVGLEYLLEQSWCNGRLKSKVTGKVYSFDNANYNDFSVPFCLERNLEIEYNGNKYVRFATQNYDRVVLSNNENYKIGDYCWLKVEPIKWLVDEKADIAISKNILFTGIQYCNSNSNISDLNDFKSTNIKRFMDTYFSKEILTEYEYDKLYKKEEQENIYNPYNFNFDEVSEEEIIKGCVESNIAVMLHGRSGDGKSARVKELDPDAEILYLINASPDSLGGKSVLVNGEMKDIPPTWYTKLEEKCEKEPDKIHIVFFDEITNAPPSIQGMAFNIILDKEVNGKWKLPQNARIVAAGNELEESRSAYGMSEPLFNRFAHVYIETKVEDWLSWASTPSKAYERLDYKKENVPMKIHPSVYAFIVYKGENALRTKYTGKTPNADPRKWELASKVLYETRKPEMIRSLVGDSLTREFISFCQQRVITLEDVLSGNYTDSDLDMNTGEKYNTAVGLSSVSIEHFERVREFVKRLGPEICATFETLWAHGIEERLEKIQEIKLSERIK